MLYASEANDNGDEKLHYWRGPIADLVVNYDTSDVLAISFHDKLESSLGYVTELCNCQSILGNRLPIRNCWH